MATQAAAIAAKELGYDVIVWSHAVEGKARELGRVYAQLANLILQHHIQKAVRGSLGEVKHGFLSLSKQAASIFSNPVVERDFLKLSEQLIKSQSQKLCLLSGGEPTVTVTGSGVGGRNQEMALAFAYHIHELQDVWLLRALDQQEENKVGVCHGGSKVAGKGGLVFGCVGTDGQDGPCEAAGAVVDMGTCTRGLEQGLDPECSLGDNDSYTFFNQLDGGRSLVRTGLTGTNVMDLHVLLFSQRLDNYHVKRQK